MLTSGGSAVGPLIASFVVGLAPETWRDFTWVCAGLAGFNLLAMYFFYPESNFRRPQVYEVAVTNEEKVKSSTHLETATEKGEAPLGVQHVDHVQISWPRVWTSLIRTDSTMTTVRAFIRPLLTLAYPSVLWAVILYGTSLASQVILIFAFPSLLLAPPYLFAPSSVGLMQIAAIIGFLIACFGGGYISDYITARRIVRAGGS